MTHLLVHVPASAVPAGKLQTPTATEEGRRAPLRGLMAVTLANTLDLKGRLMQARWHARQLDSNGLAVAFDELGDDLDLLADLLGQRMVALGQQPRALPADVTQISRLPPSKHAILWDSQLVEAVGKSVETAKHYLEPTISAAIDAGDAATVDVLQRLKRRLNRCQQAVLY